MAGRIRSLKASEVRNAGVDRNPMAPVNTKGSQVSLHGGPRLKGNAPTHYHKGGGKSIAGTKDTIRMSPSVVGKGRGAMPMRGKEKVGN